MHLKYVLYVKKLKLKLKKRNHAYINGYSTSPAF